MLLSISVSLTLLVAWLHIVTKNKDHEQKRHENLFTNYILHLQENNYSLTNFD